MAEFVNFRTHGEVDIRYLDGEEWLTLAEIHAEWDGAPAAGMLVVPKLFQTDLASVPKALRWGVPKLGRWNRAAILHDWLYWASDYPDWDLMTRKQADKLFLVAMKHDGVSWFRRNLMYAAVRVGGRFLWGPEADDLDKSWSKLVGFSGTQNKRNNRVVHIVPPSGP